MSVFSVVGAVAHSTSRGLCSSYVLETVMVASEGVNQAADAWGSKVCLPGLWVLSPSAEMDLAAWDPHGGVYTRCVSEAVVQPREEAVQAVL